MCKLGTFSPTPNNPERIEGLENELIINHTYMLKPP